ncbi:MAG: SLC13 family permease [Rhodanobacteraceae bacterium]|nr:SLC13 family permease [Rhodanobacteraceae bacterium]
MSSSQILIFALVLAAGVLFMWGRWRHDMVAIAVLLAAVMLGLVAPAVAFSGFGHPAVISVACVLILSKGLQDSGAVNLIARYLLPGKDAGYLSSVAALTLLGAALSAFMNNVGALALLMPVALQMAERQQRSAGQLLMPLAFGSILGGMVTLVGTPPNLIVSGFRAELGGSGFAMFDFTPVGLAVAAAGLVLVIFTARYLVPSRERAGADSFEIGTYLTETRVLPNSKLVGKQLREIEAALEPADGQIVGLIRNQVRLTAPNMRRTVLAGDILIIEADMAALTRVLGELGLVLEEAHVKSGKSDSASAEGQEAEDPVDAKAEDTVEVKPTAESRSSEAPQLAELVLLPHSSYARRSATDLSLRTRFGINLLAISRQGRRSTARLRTMTFKPGDVLLVQGSAEAIADFATASDSAPLATRSINLPDRRRAWTAALILAASIGAAASGLLAAHIAFAAGALASMFLSTVPARAVYEAVDWPVIVMLAALIPVAGALQTTGAADMLAHTLLDRVAQGHPALALTLILVVTMTLSDFMNNAATAAIMCPIAIGVAAQLGVSTDPFLMAVAVGASCAFLTPIGHQNNTLILGPGGFHFGDYWRLGLPLELVIVLVSVPTLLWVWPLSPV